MTPAVAVALLSLLAYAASARLPFRSPVFLDENALSPVAKYGGPSAYVARDWVRLKHSGPRMSRASPGAHLELECEASGSPTPSVQWYHNGSPVNKGLEESNSIGSLRLGNVKARLAIDCVAPRHQGTYTCVAVSGTETVVSQPSLLFVQGNNASGMVPGCSASTPPHILSWSPNLLETMGNDVVLPCVSAGSPRPQVYWIDSQNNLLTLGPSDNQQDDRFKVLDSGDLMISDVRWADMGIYTCVAESPLGRDTITTFLYPMSKDR